MATPFHKAFTAWAASSDNPLVNASESVQYSMWPALRAAFRGGIEYERTGPNIFGGDEDEPSD